MKILVISHQSNKSGAPRLLLNIFPKLNRESNIELLFVLNKYQEAAKEFIEKFHTEYFFIDKYKLTRDLFVRLNLYDTIKLWWFKKILKHFSPDLIYINTTSYNLLSQHASKTGLNYFVHVHETDNSIKLHAHPEYLNELIKGANLIIGCSDYVSKFIKANFNVQNVKTIYENIDTSRFNNKSDFSFRQFENFSSSDVLVGVTGAPQYRKGTDIFIRAAILFNQKHPNNNFKFIWVGGTADSHNNEYYRSCLQIIKQSEVNNIELIDQIDDIQNLYTALDLFVIPSREDPFPLSMLEAMYFKVPVIGSRVSGIPEALSDNCGELFESEDIEGLSNLFQKFANDKTGFTKNSENAYNKFLNSFTVEIIYPELKKILIS